MRPFGDRLPAGALEAKNVERSRHADHVDAALMRLAFRLGISVSAAGSLVFISAGWQRLLDLRIGPTVARK